jgi:uncharacterized membrane protein YkvA (DUF1232 family)
MGYMVFSHLQRLSSMQGVRRYCFGASLERLIMLKIGLLLTKFRKELLLVWAMLRDSRTPGSAKLMAILALLYVVSPVDLVPDVLPILGWLDDGVIALALIKLAQRMLPPELAESLRSKIQK